MDKIFVAGCSFFDWTESTCSHLTAEGHQKLADTLAQFIKLNLPIYS